MDNLIWKMPTDPAVSYLEIEKGSKIAYTSEGKGPVVFLLHGIPGTVRDFRYLAPALAAQGVRAIRIDWPGFGKTPHVSFSKVCIEERARFVPRVADIMGIEKFAILGHSFGGSTAFATASLFPKRVQALALVNSIGSKRHRTFPKLPRFLIPVVYGALEFSLVQVEFELWVKQLYKNLGFSTHFSFEDYRVHLKLIMTVNFARNKTLLRNLKCPTLVAASKDDALVQKEISLQLFADLPKNQHNALLLSDEGGHYSQKYSSLWIAEEFAQMMRAIL